LDESAVVVKSLGNSKFFSNILLNSDTYSQTTESNTYNLSLSMSLNPSMLLIKYGGKPMREIKKKQYWASLALLAFVLIIAVGYFMIYPSVEELKQSNVLVAAKQKDNQDLQNKITTLQNLDKEMAEIRKK
jgi:putative Mn2+ efflux pump MntP